uniref:Uncharacterized protein n=1 Tax=Amorphochlora amoebiformis TaxID=1561963 RepID=A0A7S0DHF9_9EUKA|mmetsp:Transcript_25184/g.39804  ORF Transcript_25184/g.39804 Transcript_25184/m.39804 type:complete len:234 (+) Transcript_25184:87-788(+)
MDIPDHIMDIEGWDQTHLHGLPSPFTLDVRGHQGPTMGPHMQITANQGSKVEANQHPPSPMSVVEPAQAGGPTFLPGVNVPPQVGCISHVGVHGLTSLEIKTEEIQETDANKSNWLKKKPTVKRKKAPEKGRGSWFKKRLADKRKVYKNLDKKGLWGLSKDQMTRLKELNGCYRERTCNRPNLHPGHCRPTTDRVRGSKETWKNNASNPHHKIQLELTKQMITQEIPSLQSKP